MSDYVDRPLCSWPLRDPETNHASTKSDIAVAAAATHIRGSCRGESRPVDGGPAVSSMSSPAQASFRFVGSAGNGSCAAGIPIHGMMQHTATIRPGPGSRRPPGRLASND
jgi:hypothetical protein